MAEYIIDATVVMHHMTADAYTTNARALFSQITPSDRLIVPEFCLLECTNVIWKQVRFYAMLQADGETLISDLRALPVKLTPVKRLLDDAFKIGLRRQLAVYDSVSIALARQLNYPLITVDQPQLRAATAEGVILKPLTDFKP